MARNLVVCCDGTWNSPDQKEGGLPCPTNVVKLFNLCVADADQLTYYHPGVGVEGSRAERLLGGGIGLGLGRNVLSAYAWLCRNYADPDDRIFLFGFSRGAYTVRSLGGFVTRCGLLDLSGLSDKVAWERIDTAYRRGYRERQPDWRDGLSFLPADRPDKRIGVHFIGVWDTVGALGIPDDMVVLDQLLDNPERYRFHDTELSDAVLHARHALAMDERRASFAPTLWTDYAGRQEGSVKQLWFPGTHCDVGGGHVDCGLSDGALKWMAKEAADQGLRIVPELEAQLRPDSRAVLHDSATGMWQHLRTLPRATPPVSEAEIERTISRSVWERHRVPPLSQAPYWPTRVLAAGEHATLAVYARDHWNATGLFLEAGMSYEFAAHGEWLDKSIPCGPAGAADGKFHAAEVVHLLGNLIGEVEALYQKATSKKDADWWGTRRCEQADWFALVGVIANQDNIDGGGTPTTGETFVVGAGVTYTPSASGYLYCFANDAWKFYGNNRGSVQLTVRRI